MINRRQIHDNPKREKEARLNLFRLAKGVKITDLCSEIGISVSAYCNLNSGARSPVARKSIPGWPKGGLVEPAQKLIDYFNCQAYDLFPRYFCEFIGEEATEITDSQAIGIGGAGYLSVDVSRQVELREFLGFLFSTTTATTAQKRGIRILKMWYLYGLTLEEMGKREKISKERVRQIIKKGERQVQRRLNGSDYMEKGSLCYSLQGD
jgi:transcriptional regulator with XRE-family HTH domain